MIVRIWRGLTEPESAKDYLEYMENSVLPRLLDMDGFRGVDVLTRDCKSRVEFLVQTRWASMDNILAWTGEDFTCAVVEPQAQTMLVDWDRTVRHYTGHVFGK